MWLLLYCVVCLLALVWPGYPWAAEAIGPMLLGVPTALVWNIGWVLATFVVMLLVERRHVRRSSREPGADAPKSESR